MLIAIACLTVAAILGLAVLGHMVALHVIFASADHADSRREGRTSRSFLPDVPV